MPTSSAANIEVILWERHAAAMLAELLGVSLARLPNFQPLNSAIGTPPIKQAPLAALCVARAELRAMPPAELDRLASECRALSHQRASQARGSRLARQREREAAAEAARFYNQPAANADFGHWVTLDYWTAEEAAALLLSSDVRASPCHAPPKLCVKTCLAGACCMPT